jgi:hypothetical protein
MSRHIPRTDLRHFGAEIDSMKNGRILLYKMLIQCRIRTSSLTRNEFVGVQDIASSP